jgi:hypothetical protein
MYWQEPDDEDLALADPVVRGALLPMAQALISAPAASWWATPAATTHQQYVAWLAEGGSPPSITGATAELAAWRTALIEEERAAQKRPKALTASVSGHWWSTPAHARLTSTTRSLPGLGAVGLALVEDGLGWEEARCWPMEPQTGARIYEVSGPAQWAELVARYPVEVTAAAQSGSCAVTCSDACGLDPLDALHPTYVPGGKGRAVRVGGLYSVWPAPIGLVRACLRVV